MEDYDSESGYETYSMVELAGDPTASELARQLVELFADPTVVTVMLHFAGDGSDERVVEFGEQDIGSIGTSQDRVTGTLRETPPVEELAEIRTCRRPWLADLFDAVVPLTPEAELRLQYTSRFGGEVVKTMVVVEREYEFRPKPFGYTADSDESVIEGHNVRSAALFGYAGEAEIAAMVHANGGMNILMNGTQVVEPGTVPAFELVGEEP